MDPQYEQYERYVTPEILDDVVDNLIEINVINEEEYRFIWSKEGNERKRAFYDVVTKKDPRILHELLSPYYINLRNSYRDAIVLGGIPKKPKNYIERTSLTNSLKDKLKTLTWEKPLIIFGPMGYGKSSLLTSVLHMEQITSEYFGNALFWVNFEEQNNQAYILQAMWRLYNDAVHHSRQTPVTHCPDEIIDMNRLLRAAFTHDSLKDALLILDGISSGQVVEAFDIGCKTIVTTQIKPIANYFGGNYELLKVQAGFTREETLKLFSSCMDEKSLRFVEEAKKIHSLCKGHPMVVSLIGSYLESNKENARCNVEEWKHIIEVLNSGNYTKLENTVYDEEKRNIFRTIEMCIDNLPEALRTKYIDLCIFREDVNIMPNVLSVLWGIDRFEVRKVMTDLENRSLIISFYHKDYQSYIYGIHDIYLKYLKKSVMKNNCAPIHRQLVENYGKITNEDMTNLPDDNYILQYIGYHLFGARMTDRFPPLYFDLRFLENKIKSVGVVDLLEDFRIYEDYITRNEEEKELLLEDYKRFVLSCGPDIYAYKNTNIIQWALQEDENSEVYKIGKAYAAAHPGKPYFKISNQTDKRIISYKPDYPVDITAACFAHDENHVLFGSSSGVIMLINMRYQRKYKKYEGHTGKILVLKMRNDGKTFLSLSEDKTVKVWQFELQNLDDSQLARNKQKKWVDLEKQQPYTCLFTINTYREDEFPISASFSHQSHEKFMVTGTTRATITVWNEKGKLDASITGRGYPAKNVLFSLKDDYIIYTSEECVIIYDAVSMAFVQQYRNDLTVDGLILSSNPHMFYVVDRNAIKYVTWALEGYKFSVLKQYKSNNQSFIGAALTSDGRYLVRSSLGNNINKILIEDTVTEKIVEEESYSLSENVILDTLVRRSDNKSHVLLISYDSKTFQLFRIPPNEGTLIPKGEALSLFSCFWLNKLPIIALVNKANTIKIFQEYTEIASSEAIKDNITCICFSVDGDRVVYGTENGQVNVYEYKTKATSLMMKLDHPIVFLKCLDLGEPKDSVDVDRNVVFAQDSESHVKVHYRRDSQGSTLIVQNVKNLMDVEIICSKLLIASRRNIVMIDFGLGLKTNQWSADAVMAGNIYNVDFNPRKGEFFVLMSGGKLLVSDLVNDTVETIDFSIDKILENLIYSSDTKYLATTDEAGKIKIFNGDNLRPLTELMGHESSVEKVLFSKLDSSKLVSIGDQIIWWDIKKAPKAGSSSSIASYQNGLVRRSKKEILSCVKLYGHRIKFISSSSDFKSFIALDNNNKIYLISSIEQAS